METILIPGLHAENIDLAGPADYEDYQRTFCVTYTHNLALTLLSRAIIVSRIYVTKTHDGKLNSVATYMTEGPSFSE